MPAVARRDGAGHDDINLKRTYSNIVMLYYKKILLEPT
jgi:hypothetical protein